MKWYSCPLTLLENTRVGEAEMRVVFDYLTARRRGDVAAAGELLDPAVVHQGVSAELVCTNREQVLERVAADAERPDAGIDRLELFDAGGGRVVLGLGGPRFAEVPWLQPDQRLFVVHMVRDGRIVRMEDFRTQDEALAATKPGI